MNNDTPDMKMTYAAAGVDIDAATQAKKRIRGLARATFTPGVLTDIGSFGALFRLEPDRYAEPLLVSSCDGVGTKLKVAFMTGIHDTVGLRPGVALCLRHHGSGCPAACSFWTTSPAASSSRESSSRSFQDWRAAAARAGCALIGGETAEMPDFYAPGEYDLAGFIVGVVDRPRLIDGSRIRTGDILLGLPSAGLHTNGYSLAR